MLDAAAAACYYLAGQITRHFGAFWGSAMIGKAKATGFYHHEMLEGGLYEVGPDGEIIMLLLSTRPTGGGGVSVSYDQSSNPTPDLWGSSHTGYSFSLYEFDSWQWGPYAGASWHGLSYTFDQWQHWSPWSYSTSVETSLSEYWGGWTYGPSYQVSWGHGEFQRTFDSFGVSRWGQQLSITSLHQEEQSSFDFSSLRIDGLQIERQHSERAASLDLHQDTHGPEGRSSFDLVRMENDSFDFSRVQVGQNVSVEQMDVHTELALTSWQNPWSQGYERIQGYASHEYDATSGPGYSSIHEVTAQVTQVDQFFQIGQVPIEDPQFLLI